MGVTLCQSIDGTGRAFHRMRGFTGVTTDGAQFTFCGADGDFNSVVLG